MRKVKPLNDFVFKSVFGKKGNEDILKSFINAVLKRTNKDKIESLEIIENKELTKELIEDKTGIIDVRAKTFNGEHIDIEVQLTDQGNMDKRTLFYWGKMYIENIKKGQDYSNLEKVITINILDFDFLGTESYQSSFHLWEDIEKDYMLTDIVEIHFIELPKFRRKGDKDLRDNTIERWLTFLEKDISESTLQELISMQPEIAKAESELQYLSSNDKMMQIYRAREASLHERANMIKSAEEKGIKQGIEEGKKKAKIEVAKNLLDILDDQTIAFKTGLSKEEVAKIRNSVKI